MHVLQYQYHSAADGEDAFNAGKRLPWRWYERGWWHAGAGFLVGAVVQVAIWQLASFPPPLWLSLATILCYLGGFLFDVVATHRHVSLKSHFDARGLAMPTREANPLLPDYPTLAQQIFSIATLISLLYLPVSFFLPGVGFSAAIVHGLAGLANRRAYRRAAWILNRHDARAQGNWRSSGGGERDKRLRASVELTLLEIGRKGAGS